MDERPAKVSKRARKSCERCRLRKQRCQGFPVCTNCKSAKEQCVQPPSAIEEYRSGPNQALLERISFLEAQLAALTNGPVPQQEHDPLRHGDPTPDSYGTPIDGRQRRESHIADIVGFLSLGGEAAYVGSSSGFSMASNLGQMVQATVWNKALSSTISEQQPKPLSLAEMKKNSAGPPNDEMGDRILDAYFTRMHLRYPFLDRSDILDAHAKRFTETDSPTPQEQFGTFKIYMIYGIGSTMLKLTEAYDYTPPENFFMTALQYISAARESNNSINNIQAMALLVLYNLRSPSNSGIWYMIGLAMRTCVDLGLHREAHYLKQTPYQGQLRRRLFWSVYFLERVIAVSLGRPYSIADRDIDAELPLDIDDTVRDDGLISRTIAASSSATFLASRPTSNLTMGIQLIKLKRLESHIQNTIYRVDRPLSSLVSKIPGILTILETWQRNLPPSQPSETDYLHMHYNKAIRLLLQPFLTVLSPSDPNIALCLHASGQICQIFKRLHQRDSYGHSFVALHSVFIAGVTMCYCLFIAPALWTFSVSNDLRACSSALFVMAERTPAVKKYRDALETVISATMEFMARPTGMEQREIESRADHEVVQSLLGLSAQQSPDQIKLPSLKRNRAFLEDDNADIQRNGGRSGYGTPRGGQEGMSRLSAGSQDGYDGSRAAYEGWNGGPGAGSSTGSAREWEAPQQSEMHHQMDAEWLLSLCEGDGFSLQMLNEMMRFEPSLGA